MNLKPSYILIALIAIIFGIGPLIGLYTEYLWFDMAGYLSVFTTIITWRILLFLVGFILIFGFIYANISVANRKIRDILGTDNEKKTDIDGFIIPGALLISFVFALSLSGQWETILLFLNMVPTGLEDPIFNQDISFYLFQLPLLEYIRNILFSLTIFVLIFVGLIYLYKLEDILAPQYSIESDNEFQVPKSDIAESISKIPTGVIAHISILFGFLLLIVAFTFYLNRFDILFTQNGVVAGAGYTDVNVTLPLLTITAILCAVVAAAIIANVRSANLKIPLIGLTVVVILILLTSFVPSAYQQFVVEPTELQLEEPYLEHNIEFTRQGFGISDVKIKPFDYDTELSHSTVENNQDIISTLRVWDPRALMSTYRQTQQIRTYYEFNDVDTDRYHIDDEYRQFMISVREMDITELDPSARTWVNERLVYTHGYGAVMSDVSAKTNDGRPVLSLQDIPPRGEFELTNPRIYYGELTRDYKIVNTDREELDYPRAEGNVFYQYTGTGGVQLDSISKRLAYMLRLGDVNFVLSQYINDDSRVIYDHEIRDRASKIAPFLIYDNDPYPVIHEGRIVWIIDAYTISEKYPYSQRYRTGAGDINYIRNSVKVVVDAYEGSVDYYVMEEEPLIDTYSKIFPDLFKPYEDMPEGLKDHIRYPSEFFNVQMDMYRIYHMTDVENFYNREDAWQAPREYYRGTTVPMEPYYIITRLPEENELEYILMQPFTPRNRQNMIAWMAARCDEPNYGQLVQYEFPKDRLIYGPNQIEARIDQDPVISELFTLWGQQGSSVIRGNMLVVPLENSVLYVEPVFISADEGEIPELRRIIVSTGENLYMGLDIETAINVLLGEEIVDEDGEGVPIPQDARELAQQAMEHYNRAQEHLSEGDWSGYGEEMDNVRDILEQISQLIPQTDVEMV